MRRFSYYKINRFLRHDENGILFYRERDFTTCGSELAARWWNEKNCYNCVEGQVILPGNETLTLKRANRVLLYTQKADEIQSVINISGLDITPETVRCALDMFQWLHEDARKLVAVNFCKAYQIRHVERFLAGINATLTRNKRHILGEDRGVRGRRRYPWRTLKVGESFVIEHPVPSRGSLYNAAKQQNMKVSTNLNDDKTLTVTRIE